MNLIFNLAKFNDKWNLNIQPEFPVQLRESEEEKTADIDGGQFRLRKYVSDELPVPLYKFGLMLNDVKRRPGNGGEWSSRSAIVNPIFDTKLLEIAFHSVAISIDKDDLEKICPEIKCELKNVRGENEWHITIPEQEWMDRPAHTFIHNV